MSDVVVRGSNYERHFMNSEATWVSSISQSRSPVCLLMSLCYLTRREGSHVRFVFPVN
jgi:hypothetical protein